MRHISFFFIFIFLTIGSFAQTFSGALEKQPVAVGEPFMIEYTLQGGIGINFVMPDYDKSAFFLIEENQAEQMIETNGRRSFSTTFALTFKPLQPGHHTFSPATVTIDGIHRKLRSNALELDVENSKGFNQQQPQVTQVNPQTPQQGTSSSEDVVLIAVPSKRTAYLGEPILLTYKLLTRKNLTQPQVTDNPQYAGFWRDDLETKASKGQVEMYQGKRFTSYEVKREFLYPQKSGDLLIPTFGLQVEMESREQSWLEKMLGAPALHESVQVNSQPLTIQVKPLPTSSQPTHFNGWVGNFKADFLLLNNPTKVGEPLQVNVTLVGKGNLRMTTPPKWEVGSDFESYEPEAEDHLHKETHDITGFRVFKYSFIPNKVGDFTLPPLKLYFFDYEQNKYDSIVSPSYAVNVLENPDIASSFQNEKMSKSDSLQFQSNMPVTDLQNWKGESPAYFWVWAVLGNLLLGFIGIFFYEKRKATRQLAAKNAFELWEKAQVLLQKAQQEMANPNSDIFYENLLFALKTALQHFLQLPNLSFNKTEIIAKLQEKNIEHTLIESILAIWQNCESALFGKVNVAAEKQDLYENTKKVILKLK